MPENLWYVDSIQEFSCFKCPECVFDSKLENDFQEHAVENHPLSFVHFGKLYKEEVFDESLIIDENKLDIIESYIEDVEVHETPIYSTESILKDGFAESENYVINEIDSKEVILAGLNALWINSFVLFVKLITSIFSLRNSRTIP